MHIYSLLRSLKITHCHAPVCWFRPSKSDNRRLPSSPKAVCSFYLCTTKQVPAVRPRPLNNSSGSYHIISGRSAAKLGSADSWVGAVFSLQVRSSLVFLLVRLHLLTLLVWADEARLVFLGQRTVFSPKCHRLSSPPPPSQVRSSQLALLSGRWRFGSFSPNLAHFNYFSSMLEPHNFIGPAEIPMTFSGRKNIFKLC